MFTYRMTNKNMQLLHGVSQSTLHGNLWPMTHFAGDLRKETRRFFIPHCLCLQEWNKQVPQFLRLKFVKQPFALSFKFAQHAHRGLFLFPISSVFWSPGQLGHSPLPMSSHHLISHWNSLRHHNWANMKTNLLLGSTLNVGTSVGTIPHTVRKKTPQTPFFLVILYFQFWFKEARAHTITSEGHSLKGL